ncbi:MAG: DUF2997 domain-containing protein [Myxococcales bacterium]|nr:DUF2997 domain-containing protein [Myxococcales bacterium]
MHDLKIEITADGKVEILVDGYKGPDCVELTKWLEEQLGSVADRELTQEYYEEAEKEKDEIKLGD